MTDTALKRTLDDLFDELAALSRALGGPDDLAALLTDADDYPDIDTHPDANYALGYIAGAAAALGLTPLELVDSLGCTLDRETRLATMERTR